MKTEEGGCKGGGRQMTGSKVETHKYRSTPTFISLHVHPMLPSHVPREASHIFHTSSQRIIH